MAIIRAEVEADELEVAQAIALSDDDAAGLREPVTAPKPAPRPERREMKAKR